MRSLMAGGLLLALVLIAPGSAFAAGGEWKARQDDLVVSVDIRWAGCSIGGYYPIRVRLQNRAEARTVTIRFKPFEFGLPTVTRTLDLSQNASASTSLLVPMVGSVSYGEFEVDDNSGPLRDLTHQLSISPGLSNTRLSLLVIAGATVDCTGFEGAISSLMGASRSGYGSVSTGDHQVIPPVSLPDTWIAYSGLDLVAVSKAMLSGLTHENRSALLDWVRSGGTILIYEVGEDPASAAELDTLVGFEQASRKTAWQSARTQRRRPITVTQFDSGPDGDEETTFTPTADQAEFVWEGSSDAFAIRSLGLGQVVGIRGNPFPGSVHDWAWLINSLGASQLKLGDRLGVAGRTDNEEFLDFLIPGIQSIPVVSFLIFISVFTFVIGPLNYYMLNRRKRLNLLVVTIPGVAAITSVLLFAYSAVAHGFSVKSRVRSLTILDQGSQTAISTARLALYAGFTPSGGLEFSPNTAVTPIWPSEQGFESGRVDWTETQALRSGFLRARTRTQFLTTEVRNERGRLTINSGDAGSMRVANGLEWDLAALIVTDKDGNSYFGKDLPAGGSKEVSALTDGDRKSAREMLRRSHPSPPEELASGDNVTMFDGFSRRRYYYNRETFLVSSGQMERKLAAINLALQNGNSFEKRSYIALVKEKMEKSPVEFGTETTVVDDFHVIVGYY